MVRLPLRALILLLAVAPEAARAAAQQEVADPYSCPPEEVAVRHPVEERWICKPRLRIKRDVFAPPKHDLDPCPEGTWWHKYRDPCLPIVCKTEQNGDLVPPQCGPGQHEHLHTGADWSRPLICVADYQPGNERTGGKRRGAEGCGLCVINQKGHRGENQRPWATNLRKPKPLSGGGRPSAGSPGPSPKGRRLRGGQGGVGGAFKRPRRPCPKGSYSVLAGRPSCRPCQKGTATVRTREGLNICVGGASAACPDGPKACLPCAEGEKVLIMNRRPVCLRHSCGKGRLPVPERGGGISCRPPLEDSDSLDWDILLGAPGLPAQE